jgi:hypothetical protein
MVAVSLANRGAESPPPIGHTSRIAIPTAASITS